MKRDKERGFALISVLALISILSLLVVSIVISSQYTSTEIMTYSAVNRSFYTTESALNRIVYFICLDKLNNTNRILGEQNYTENNDIYIADGVIHNLKIYNSLARVQIFDAVNGIDISGNFPSRNFSNHFKNRELNEFYKILSNRIIDYVDKDDFVRLNSFERMQYENLGIFNMPRNESLQFREEVRFIPGFNTVYPVNTEGYLSCFRLIAPKKMRPLIGRSNLYSTSHELIIQDGALSQNESIELRHAFKEWQENRIQLADNLSPKLMSLLLNKYSIRESGIYSILISTSTDKFPGVTLRATIFLNNNFDNFKFYEFFYL